MEDVIHVKVLFTSWPALKADDYSLIALTGTPDFDRLGLDRDPVLVQFHVED